MTLEFDDEKRGGRTDSPTIDKIYNFFISYPDKKITPQILVDELNIPYNTASGSLFRLWKEGSINRIAKGEYVLAEIEKGEKTKEISQKRIDEDVNKNVEIFKNKSENHNIRLMALEKLQTLSKNHRVANNKSIIELIKTIPEEEDVELQGRLLGILTKIIGFENSSEGNKEIKNKVKNEFSETMSEIFLNNNLDISYRIVSWELYVGMKSYDEDVIKSFFIIARSDDLTWEKIGRNFSCQLVSKLRKTNKKNDFLKKLDELIREKDGKLVDRGKSIQREVLIFYDDYYLNNQ